MGGGVVVDQIYQFMFDITYLTTDFHVKISFFYDRWLKLTAESKDGSEMKTCDLSAMRTIFNTNRI